MLNRKISRREFLWQSLLTGAGITILHKNSSFSSPTGIVGANERIRVGIIGLGDHGFKHLTEYLKLPNVEIAAICDIDESRLGFASQELSRKGFSAPFKATDHRYLLDLSELDLVSIATPRKKRVEIGLDGCAAGKHLMLEKPFSASIETGRDLVTIAAQTGLLAQQCDNSSFVSFDEVPKMIPSISSCPIHAVQGWKRIKLSPVKNVQVGHSANLSGAPYDKLLEFAFDELDAARCLLGVETPVNIAAMYFTDKTQPQLSERIALQYDFKNNKAGGSKLNFELRFDFSGSQSSTFNNQRNYPTNKNSLLNDEQTLSELHFFTHYGKFSVQSNSGSELFNTENNPWENIVSCIRTDNSDGLQNPIKEAQKSCELLHLAETSLKDNQI